MTKKIASPFRFAETDKPKNNYIDKLVMWQYIKDYQESLAYAKENNLLEPIMSNELGKCILDIATNLTKRHNFAGYTFREQFISDGVLLGLHLAKTFDTTQESRNPHSYFSFAMFRSFVAVIKKESKLLEGKYEYINQLDIDLAAYQDHDTHHDNSYIEYLKESVDEAMKYKAQHKKTESDEENEIDVELIEIPVAKTNQKPSKYVELDF